MQITEEIIASSKQCSDIIQQAHIVGFSSSSGGKTYTGRESKSTWVSKETEGVKSIYDRIVELTGVPFESQTDLNVLRYDIGDFFRVHTDTNHNDEDIVRRYTSIIYLNDGYQGGQTHFPLLDYTIEPSMGKMIMWQNIDSRGELIKESAHESLEVKSGRKYAAVIWSLTKP